MDGQEHVTIPEAIADAAQIVAAADTLKKRDDALAALQDVCAVHTLYDGDVETAWQVDTLPLDLDLGHFNLKRQKSLWATGHALAKPDSFEIKLGVDAAAAIRAEKAKIEEAELAEAYAAYPERKVVTLLSFSDYDPAELQAAYDAVREAQRVQHLQEAIKGGLALGKAFIGDNGDLMFKESMVLGFTGADAPKFKPVAFANPAKTQKAAAPVDKDAIRKRLDGRTLDLSKPDPDPRPILYNGITARGRSTVIAGTGGVGKSTLDAALTVDMACGGGLFGDAVAPLRVALFNVEDDTDEVDRLVRAAAKANGKTNADFGNRIICCGRDWWPAPGPVIIDGDPRNPHAGEAFLDTIEAVAELHDADVVIIDPLAGGAGGHEMTPAALNALQRALVDVAKANDIAIILVAHTRKKQTKTDRGDDVEDISGGKTLSDAARCVVTLSKLTAKEAEEVKIPVAKAGDYVRAKVVKSNISRAGRTFWARFVQQEMKSAGGAAYDVQAAVPTQMSVKITSAEHWLYDAIKKRIETQFIMAAMSGKKAEGTVRLSQVIKEAADAVEAHVSIKQIIDSFMAKGWLAKDAQVNPTAKSNDKVQRVVLGPVDPYGPIPDDAKGNDDVPF